MYSINLTVIVFHILITKSQRECLLRGLTSHPRSLKRGYSGFPSAVDFITQGTGNELRPIQSPNGKQRRYSTRSSAPFTAITQMRNVPPVHLMSLRALIYHDCCNICRQTAWTAVAFGPRSETGRI